MKKKILVVVYNLERAKEHEWYVEFMDSAKYEIHFVLIRKPKSHLHRFLEMHGIQVFCYDYKGKYDLPILILKLTKLMLKQHYDIVHTHLFESSLAGLMAARIAGVKNRVITRHHSDYHHVYFPASVKFDKLINSLATKIIAVSRNVENILLNREHTDAEKVITIPHGIRVNDFHPDSISEDRKVKIRNKYRIPPDTKVVGVVSRFISWKGLQYIIPAFYEVKKIFPDALLILANAQGPYSSEILKLLESFNPESYRLVSFEEDTPALYAVFNCFVHTPVSETSEAFGQTYIEALAAGVPAVFTLSGIAHDFAENEVNCLLVPHRDASAIAAAVTRLLDTNSNNGINNLLIKNGLEVVRSKFLAEIKYQRLSELYDSMN